jgi:PAS domain S-box-containing protein
MASDKPSQKISDLYKRIEDIRIKSVSDSGNAADALSDVLGELEIRLEELFAANEELALQASFPILNPNPVTDVDQTGQVHFLNPVAQQLFPDLQESGRDHLWLADWKAVAQALQESETGAYTRDISVGDRWYQQTIYSVPGTRHIHIYGWDITERRQAEEALKTSETRYRRLFEAAQDGILILDGNTGLITDINPFLVDLLGYSHQDLLNKPLWDIGLFKDINLSKNAFSELQSNGYIRYEDLPLLTKDGRIIDVEFVSNVYLVDDKKVIQCNIRDITRRKQAEEAQRLERSNLEIITQNIGAGLAIISNDYRTIWANKVLQDIFGNCIGAVCHATFNLRDEICPGCGVREIFERGKEKVVHEQIGKDRAGNIIWSQIIATPIRDHNGCITSVLELVIPITELKLAEDGLRKAREELEIRILERTSELLKLNETLQAEIIAHRYAEDSLDASLKEKEALIREVHHRVKNNLQIISSLLYLQSKNVDDKDTFEIFRDSQTRVKSMALIHEKLYKSENVAVVDFAEYIKSLVAYLFDSYNLHRNGIGLKTNLDKIILEMDTAVPCGLIINELVSNSLKHAFPENRKGEINIELHKNEDDQIKLVISDNGIGLKADYDKTGTLGMQLVNSLVKQLDGELRLDTCFGTRFEIIFKEAKYPKRI